MDQRQKSRIKARGVALATAGLGMALCLLLAMRGLGMTRFELRDWGYAVTATAVVQGFMFLLAHKGWDRRLRFDPHFLYVPLLAAILLLTLYMVLAPELRFITLLGWFVALLFVAGLGGFREVASLSAVMALSYLGVGALLRREGYPVSLSFETGVAASVLTIGMYAGVVFQRLRADRREMRELRVRLANMAITDPLTQLPNRRHFEDVLRAELDRVHRYGGRCTVAMVDVDHFKQYNDAVGHLAGDFALRELATLMRRELRLHDMVARIGGEEFAIIMINVSKSAAYPVLDRLRAHVEAHPFRSRDVQPGGRLTISAGVAAFPEDGAQFETLLRAADQALYRAKRSGRNRVCVAGGFEARQPAV